MNGVTEVRRVDVFQDGSLGLVGEGGEINAFTDGVKIPALEELTDGKEFFTFLIDRSWFEQVWVEAWRRLVTNGEHNTGTLAGQSG